MISIIIASVNDEQLQRVKRNIDQTIGIPYEVISFQNGEGREGLCTLYNRGIAKSRYDFICFMHEDVEIVTKGWGNVVLHAFHSNPRLGLLGVAGNTFKSSVAGRTEGLYGEPLVNIVQHYKYENRQSEHICTSNKNNTGLRSAVCVDGVWFCTPRHVAVKYRFDERLTGFHGYDLDFSLSVCRDFEVMVTFDILLHHFSEGNFSRDWLNAMMYIHKKRKDQLPVYIDLPKEIPLMIGEKRIFRYLIKKYRDELNLTLTEAWTILDNSCIRRLSWYVYMKLFFYTWKLYGFKLGYGRES